MGTNPNAHGNYSQGGFKGKASKKNAKWVQKGGNRPSKQSGGCCPMVAAIRSARRGNFRLAGRYARWSVRLIAARIA